MANNSASVVTRLPSGAKCDFDGDGLDEIVTGAGPSGGPHVRLLKVSGATVTELAGFYAYEPTFKGGAFVACGDVTGDGLPEIITGAGAGGSPHVRVFAVNAGNVTEIASFQAYAETFRGGVHVAAADTTGDGVAEIITGAGAIRRPPRARVGVQRRGPHGAGKLLRLRRQCSQAGYPSRGLTSMATVWQK